MTSVILFTSKVDGTTITLPERKFDCGIPTGKGLAPVFDAPARDYFIVPRGCDNCTDENGKPRLELRNTALKQYPTYKDTAYGARIVIPADKPKWEWKLVECTCESFAITLHNNKVYEVPRPELVQEANDDENEPVYINDTLASFISSGKAVSEALEDVGFQYADLVYVDGTQMGVIDMGLSDAMDLLKEVVPTFTIRWNKQTGNPGAYCKCGTRFLYREYVADTEDYIALSGGFPDEVKSGDYQRPHMERFVADVVEHAAVKHPGLTADDFCDHGQRRFVNSKSKRTGQPFKAHFCPKGKCDPIFDNS